MKKLIKTYRVFTPDIYSIVMFALMVLIPVAVYIFSTDGSTIGPVSSLLLFAMADIYGDYFVFGSSYCKNAGFGMLKNSHEGCNCLKMGIISDQLRRLIQMIIVVMIASIINPNIVWSAGYVRRIITACLMAYSVNTMFMNAMRLLESYLETALVGGAGVAIDALTVLLIYALGDEQYGEPLVWPIITLIFAIGATWSVIENATLKYRLDFGERTEGRFASDAGKKMVIFLLCAFGVNFAMLPIMHYGYVHEINLSVFMFAQMMYPMCGVMLGKMFSYNEKKQPHSVYIIFIITTMIIMMFSAISVYPQTEVILPGNMSLWYALAVIVLMAACITALIIILACGKEKRRNAGMNFNKPVLSVAMCLLFVVIMAARAIIMIGTSGLIDNDGGAGLRELADIFRQPSTWTLIVSMPIDLITTFGMFLGEEYGWRYYLQPIMQKKFGLRLGVILLGVLWGIWHVGADCMFYTRDCGVQMVVQQLITCISMAIFMGYVYMKTGNIWAAVIIHHINNSLAVILGGGNTTEALQNNTITWDMIPFSLLGAVVMIVFIFAPAYRKNREKKESGGYV